MSSKIQERVRAQRYNGEDEDEHAQQAQIIDMGPPCMAAVYAIPDEEKAEEDHKRAKEEQDKFRGRMRALNLNIEQLINKAETLTFIKLTAPEPMLKYEAQEVCLRVRLREKFGGALCRFTTEIEVYQQDT